MSPLRHRSVFGAKSAENGELRKVRFFVSGVNCAAWASKFACFRSKSGSRRLPCSGFRFLPGKACKFQPAEPVTALSPLAFWSQKVRKSGPSPPRTCSERGSPPRWSVSPPRWSVSPPSLSPLTSLLRHRSGFSFFRVGRQLGCLSLKFRWFSVESGLQTTTLLKTGEFQPAEHVTACHRFVTASSPLSFGPKSAQKKRSVCSGRARCRVLKQAPTNFWLMPT